MAQAKYAITAAFISSDRVIDINLSFVVFCDGCSESSSMSQIRVYFIQIEFLIHIIQKHFTFNIK